MKLKRFVAIVISLAMVLSIVPAFSLTVGAAIGDTVTYGGITYNVVGENLVPDGGFEDANGNFSWGTWFSPNGSNGNFANNCQDWFYKVNRDTNAAVLYTQSLTADDYALGTRWNDGSTGLCSLANNIAVEAGKTYHVGFDYKHKSGADTGYIVTSFVTTATASTDGTKILTPARATTSWQTASTVYTAESDGYIFFHFRWLGEGNNSGNGPYWYFDNFVVEEVKLPEASTEGTIKAALDELSLPLATKTDITLPATATDSIGTTVDVTWTSSNTDVMTNDGKVTAPADITTVTMTPSAVLNSATVTGDGVAVVVFPGSRAGTEYNSGSGYYDIGTENIVSTAGTAASFEEASGNSSLAGWYAHTGQETNGAMNWVDASVDVVPDGNWAYAGWWNDPLTGSNYCTIDTMWPVTAGTYYLSFYAKKPAGGSTTYVYFSEDNAHHTADSQITAEAWYSVVSPGSDWAKYEYIINAETDGYVGFTSYNIGNNGSRGTCFDDFELYTAAQAAEDLASVTNPAAITVIAGNQPILPKTVTGIGERGSAMTVDVVWNSADFSTAGDVTVTGTAGGFSVSMTVTVLPQTFAPGDLTANGTINFPVNVTGDFYIEYDLTASNYDNLWLYHSADSALWGSGQIGLGFDNAGNGYFRAMPEAQTDKVFVTGRTYRFLIHGNVDTDTYSLTVYDTVTTSVVFTCTDYGFRKTADYINTIVMTSNGEGGQGALANVRVYAPDQASALTTYTVNVTGSVTDSYTEQAASADAVKIPYYEGNVLKTRSISGTTVTLTYAATEATLGTWATRNNVTTGSWLTEMKYLGSHNSFADTSSVFNNEGGDLFGDTGATSSSSTVINKSRTQSVGVYDQLNAGVRYFDIRLSRQSDGTFATVHGPAFEQFKPILVTIAQFAAENPGEVILLDFQALRDALYTSDKVVTGNTSYYGETAGDDNKEAYEALAKLLEETGVANYFPASGAQGSWDKKWGEITNNGAKAVILPFAKARGCNCYSRFINRSTYTSNETTYIEDSTYSNIVSNIDSTLSSVAGGASFGYIHAYRTPGVLSTTSILSMAASDNPKWISEANFATWMGSGKGDILMLNDVVTDAPTYLAKLAEYNRDGFDATYTNTVNNVTAEGATAAVPFSTSLNVESAASSASVAGYTPVTDYSISLMQFDANSVQPSSALTLTFPRVSDGTTTVDVLLSEDGSTVLAEAGLGEQISYNTTSVGNYILATKVAPTVNMTVNYVTTDGETLYTDARDFVIGALAYNIPASARQYIKIGDRAFIVGSDAQSYTVQSTDGGTTKTVTLTLVERYAVLEDMLVDPDNNVWGINATNSNSIFVASAGAERNDPATDDDGVSVTDAGKSPATLGSNRNGYLQFPVVTLNDGEAAIANFYVRTWHGNGFTNGNTTLRISGTAINDDSWTTLTDGATYTDTAAPRFTGYTKYMFTNASDNTAKYIQMDVTEMMKAAKAAGLSTITIRLGAAYGAAYIAEREACVAGGAYEGNASFIDVVTANTITVTGATKVTKMGTDITEYADSFAVPTGETIKVYTTAAYVTDDTNVYTVTDGAVTLAPDANADYRPASVGVAMVDGAQVRIGDGVDAEGKVSTGSGLRFITTVNATDSLATVTGATFGVEITAEGSEAVVDIPTAADKWQVAGSVYTSALTNLQVTNYNRNFTATPYVSIGGTKYYGTPVTRSIYKVAAGLLANGYTTENGTTVPDNSGTDYGEMPEVLVNVLNAYVNQVGIRLAFADSTLTARTTGSGAYTGDAFFNVSETTVDGTTYTVTLTPVGNAKINTNYWNEYVRINNNNSKVKVATQLTDNGDGTYTLTFDTAQVQ